MKVYFATQRDSTLEAREISIRLAGLGFEPVSTWPVRTVSGKEASTVAIDASDHELAAAAALLVVDEGGPHSLEVGVRTGQAIELHMPVVWCGRPFLDTSRPGFRVVSTLDEALDVLASWQRRLGTIGDEHARRALWVMLQADDARESSVAAGAPATV